jgi:DNA-binding cell septation regulator SpoVG
MQITKVTIKKVAPNEGLVGFAQIIVDDCLCLQNIAIFSRLNQPDKYRLVFPEKKNKDKNISLFYPLTQTFYFELEKIISDKYKEI